MKEIKNSNDKLLNQLKRLEEKIDNLNMDSVKEMRKALKQTKKLVSQIVKAEENKKEASTRLKASMRGEARKARLAEIKAKKAELDDHKSTSDTIPVEPTDNTMPIANTMPVEPAVNHIVDVIANTESNIELIVKKAIAINTDTKSTKSTKGNKKKGIIEAELPGQMTLADYGLI